MKFSNEHKIIMKAFIKARKEMTNPTNNQKNPFYNSDYYDQSEIFNAVNPHLLNNEMTMVLEPDHIFENGEKKSFIIPSLVHESGEWIEFRKVAIPITKGDAHAVAGAWTYLSRYILSLLFGLSADKDKDGNDTFTENEQNKMSKYKRGTPQ
jgi:hypothetical protein